MAENTNADGERQSARRGEPDGQDTVEAGQPGDVRETGATGETAVVEEITEPEDSSVVAHADPSDGRPWCIGYS